MSYAKDRSTRIAPAFQATGVAETINSQVVNVTGFDVNSNITACNGTVVITDGAAGYAKGCKYIKTNAGAGTDGQYINIGTTASCQFVLTGTIGTGSVDVVNLATDVLAEASVTLTAAQVKALFSTPITLVAAPGAGKYISVDEIRFKMVYGTTQYAGANNAEFRYTGAAGNKVSADLTNTILNGAATNYAIIKPVTTDLVPALNAPVVVAVPVANPTAGDSLVTIVVRYHVVTP